MWRVAALTENKEFNTMSQKDEITLEVSTPAGTYHGVFPKSAKVADVIDTIVKADELDAGKAYGLLDGDELLTPESSLADFQLGDQALLRLVPLRGHDEIILHVSTPAGVFHGSFPRKAKVAEVIAAIVEAKSLDARERLQLYHNDKPLASECTLASFELGDEAYLTLLATGDGV